MNYYWVVQAGLELLGSNNTPSQSQPPKKRNYRHILPHSACLAGLAPLDLPVSGAYDITEDSIFHSWKKDYRWSLKERAHDSCL